MSSLAGVTDSRFHRPRLPPSEPLLRAVGITICALALLLGASGLIVGHMFAAPTTLKYALTVAAPAIGVLLLTVERPLRVAVTLTIVSIPFAGAKATLAGQQLSLLTVTLALATVVAILSGSRAQIISGVGAAGIGAVALLVGPLVIGANSGLAVLVGAMVLVAWVTARVAREGEGGLTAIYWAIAAAALLQAVIAIYEYKTNHRLNLYGSAGSGGSESNYFGTAAGGARETHSTQRPTGTLYDPISLGNVLAMSCPVIVILAVRTRQALARIAIAAGGLVVVFALALSFSRNSWIGAAAGTLIACFALPRPALRMGALAAVAAVLVVAGSLALATAGTQLISRAESISNPTHASNRITAEGDRTRVEVWETAIKIFLDNPVAGVGIGRIRFSLSHYLPDIKEAANAQNTYLQVAAEAGLLGVFALLLLIGSMIRSLAQGLRGSRLPSAAALGAGVAVLIVWMTDVTIRYTPVAAFFAILIGVTSALPRLRPVNSRPGG